MESSKKNHAKRVLNDFIPRVEARMREHYKVMQADYHEFGEFTELYMEEMLGVGLANAKRLRGAFVYYSYIMNGGEKLEEVISASAAIEFIHLYLLVLDDFMDIDDRRRGHPTVHHTVDKYHREHGLKFDSVHFGNSIAVTAGIICSHFAQNIMLDLDFELERKQEAMRQLNNQIIETGHGQAHDIYNSVKLDPSEQDALNVLKWKTAIYTYQNPIFVGAILAGNNSADNMDALTQYAYPAGMAFQIQDDILGSFGDSDKSGKPDDSDIKEGKQTLLTVYAYEHASDDQKAILDAVLGKRDATPEEVQQVRDVMVDTGSLEYSKQKAFDFVNEAKATLLKNSKGQWEQEGVDFLEGIADYMIERDL